MNIYTCTIFVKDIAYMYFDFIIRLVLVIEKKYLTLKIYFQSVLFFNEPSKLFLHTCTFSIFCILMDKERYTKKCFCILRNGLYSDFKFYSDNSSSSFSYLIHGEKLLKFTTFYHFVQTLHYTGNIFYCEVNL